MKKLFFAIAYCFLFLTNYSQGEFTRVNITRQQLNKMNAANGSLHRFKDVVQDYDYETDLGKIKPIDPQRMRRIDPFEKKDVLDISHGRPGILKYQPPLKTFYPTQGPPDLMIAAGDQYLIISDAHTFSFYDKNGYVLPLKTGGWKSEWSATDFFQPLIDSANANNFPFLQNAPDNIVDWAVCGHGDSPNDKLLVEAYDVRVIYEPDIKRFIICAGIRNLVWRGNGKSLCDQYAVRIFAYALSVSNDPRDGFMMWYWTKNNYRDWPRISADKDVLIQAHNDSNGDDGTPTIYVISMHDMIFGLSHIRSFTYHKGMEGTPASVLPVAKFKKGTTSTPFDKYEMFLQGSGDNAVLYYFKKSADMWDNKPELKHTDIVLEDGVSFASQDRPVFRNGNIYFSSRILFDDQVINVRPPTWGLNLFRLPLKINGSDLEFDEGGSQKMILTMSPGLPVGNLWKSYEMPAIAVDERGTICTAFGRLGHTTGSTIHPGANYFLFYYNKTAPGPIQLIKPGDASSISSYQPEGWTPPHTTIDGYYKKGQYLDFATVTPDPQQRFVFWIAHAYAKPTGSYKMVVSKVSAY